MAKTLTGTHAEDVGGVIVEPGDEIPADADDEVVERLEAEGKLGDPAADEGDDDGSESEQPPAEAPAGKRGAK